MRKRDVLTDDVIKIAVRCMLNNMTYNLTAGYIGVNESTFFRWRQKGAEDLENDIDSVHARLCTGLKKAEGEAADELLAYIKTAGKDIKTWTAAAWLLERRHRQAYSPNADLIEKFEQKLNALAERIENKVSKQHGRKVDQESDQTSGSST
jgi:hypothetical protein